jgi:hypothetical protein
VLRDRIATLCGRADELAATRPPGDALAEWLRAFLAHARTDHGLAGTVISEDPEALGPDCHQTILDAAARLVRRAQQAGAVRDDLATGDMVLLIAGIALATAHGGTAPERPDRLLALALDALTARG